MHDVVVIGAGTAGCVLAHHLSASGRLRVLLIEAGGAPRNRFVKIPAGFTRLFQSEVDWSFETEPQTAAGGRRIYTPRGRMLGGSSNMNAMIHQWCHPADFDGWAQDGAQGWSWQEVAPVFRAQERWLGDGGDPERGREGPMQVSPNPNARPLSRAFVEAARRAGLASPERYNGTAYREGAWITELAVARGRRFSAYHAYLEPALSRRNLEVRSGAHATRILLEDARAVGVVLRREDGSEQTLRARGVVLAAGAYGSPQLLMLSGIGPADELAALGIAVHVDAPEAGANLQDHPVLPIVYRAGTHDTLARAESAGQLLRYLLLGRGMLASNGVEAFAFTRVHPTAPDAPDLELLFLPFEATPDFLTPPREHAFGLAPAVVAPRSRGRVSLRSADPLAPPRIDPGMLSDPDGVDAAVLWEGVRWSRRIAATAPLADLNAGELRPGDSVTSDTDLLDYASSNLQTVYHPTSTCRMGSDARSVVDPQLAVRGVRGLWIADASVMPSVPRGHPNAAVAMLAERGSDWIGQGLRAIRA